MRGLYTPILQIRREVFISVANAAYENHTLEQIEELPYEIIQGEVPQYRDSVYKERAIVTERLRLALGLNIRPADAHAINVTTGLTLEDLENPNVESGQLFVIPAACDACEEKSYFVSSCHNCLAHNCIAICPTAAMGFKNGKAFIDQDLCVKCGKCYDACKYHAIVKNERPCVAACGVGAITKDSLNRAHINQEKCVTCGQCMVNCSFAAIADKSQIYQLIKHMQRTDHMYAIIAPAFVGQLGENISVEQVFKGLKDLGFDHVVEVAKAADDVAVAEAKHYLEHVGKDQPYLCTSCCPGWVALAKSILKEDSVNISSELSPMAELATQIKAEDPEAVVCFIGPCTAKKREQQFPNIRPLVDYVLTYEELMGMIIAKDIDFESYEVEEKVNDASRDARGFAIKAGVARAVERTAKQIAPESEVKLEAADGLTACKTMALLAKAGRKNGLLLEGMACPGGCIGGAGTVINQVKASGYVDGFANQSDMKTCQDAMNARNK